MNQGHAALVEDARAAIGRGSRDFALASRLLDRTTRERVWLLYVWCRKCHDLMGGQGRGDDGRPAVRLAAIRALTARALTGEFCAEPAFDGFGAAAHECGIGPALADAVLDGFALDVAGWRPRTGGDLMRHCWHTGGAIGVMVALVLGVAPDDEAALDRACDLGLSFRLDDIARDPAESARYLPAEWLEEAGVPAAEVMLARHRPAVTGLVARLVETARLHDALGRTGLRRLPFRRRRAVLAAAAIHGNIRRAILRGGEQAWDRRIATSRWQRGWAVLRAAGSALFPPRRAEPAEGQLWSRQDLDGGIN